MKSLIFTSLFLLSLLLPSKKQFNHESIQIVRIQQHPFLTDHRRKLITVDQKGKLIDEKLLYLDTGVGCNSYLFEGNNNFILIDCNGHWFNIDKQDGIITNLGWKWQKDFPNED